MLLLAMLGSWPSAGLSQAPTPRKWTDVSGRVVEAALVSADEKSVTLRLANGQTATVEKARLSQADLDFLKQAPAGAVAAPAAFGAKNQPVYFSAPVDPKTWKERTPIESFGVTNYDFGSQLETPHVLVTASKKVRDSYRTAHAESAERLVHQIRSDFPALAPRLDAKKFAVFLASNTEEHSKIGAAIMIIGSPNMLWDETSITSLSFNRETAEKFGLHPVSRAFNLEQFGNDHGNIRWTERIHFLTDSVTRNALPYDNGESSWGMFLLGYSFYLEKLIAGKIETKVRFSGENELVEGFKTGWENATKKILGKSPVKPSIAKLTKQESADAEPIEVAYGYGLMRYLLGDPGRKAGLNTMLEACVKDGRIATADDYVKALGATSADDFDAKWLAYLKSPEF
jgi:hypothetical protein